ncbi:SDR family oxidoreductase [Fulvivirga ulvae]|uniref:SDR family oxidoreductase n=1 Tax=Fulvivirga ulvae TaxID=2904245 RepID=UPI001F1D60DF|nr:SDR family oxidoreductase [Fulvivirga ulvae]UII34091.1 SDR family oxidoreductase [Fulvivirga ulvae]
MTDNQMFRSKTKSISIIGMGWLGFPLGKFLVKNSHYVKGSTTTTSKLTAIEQGGIKGYHLALPDLDNRLDFFDTDILIISLPPSIKDYNQVIRVLLGQVKEHKIPWVIFVSSTSVYANANKRVIEEDAKNIASIHSGVRLLEVENLFASDPDFATTIIRFAGLYGPSREPGRFLAGKTDLNGPDSPVNLIHLDDCIGIIGRVIENEIKGQTFNACAPEHPKRKDFYTKACRSLGLEPPHFNNDQAPFKIIDSSKLVDVLQYQFIHENPMDDL